MRPASLLVLALASLVPARALAQRAAAPSLTVIVDGGVSVRFRGMPGAAGEWIALAAPGSPGTQYQAWQYTAGAHEGSLEFAGVPPGTWVARAFLGASSYVVRAQSVPFQVPDRCAGRDGVRPTLEVERDGSSVRVHFSGLCGTPSDWIAIAAVDAPATSYVHWQYTGGADRGTATFENVTPGRWVARVFTDWAHTSSHAIRAQTPPFWVAPEGCVCGDAAGTRSPPSSI